MKSSDKAIYELLKGLVSGKVYNLRAPQGETGPFIVIQEIGGERWRHINGPTGQAQVTWQVDSYATRQSVAKANALLAEDILDGYRGNVAINTDSPTSFVKICGISHENGVDLLDQTDEPMLYRRSDTYKVTYEQG